MNHFSSNDRQDEVFSKAVKAGKRTYFFDVKSTRGNDYYITITESKRNGDTETYQKHKIFLYKEDYDKFLEGLQEALLVARNNPSAKEKIHSPETENFDFEDL